MKKTITLMMATMFVAVLIFSACNRNNGDNKHEYPSTANVIRNAVKDVDGNKYDAVRIGNQVWMAENLKTTHYSDGTEIPLGNQVSDSQGYRYYPMGSKSYVNSYGYLYNWVAVMHGESGSDANPSGVQGICPKGWHVPSSAEWQELTASLKSNSIYISGGNEDHLAKAICATWGWDNCSEEDAPGNILTTNNASGFSAVPAGSVDQNGQVGGLGSAAEFWSSTDFTGIPNAVFYGVYYYIPRVNIGNFDKYEGLSVRCIQD